MHARVSSALFAVLLCALAAGCGGTSPAASSSSAAPGLRLVSLGDSDATGAGDEEGTGWVQRYADLVAEQTGSDVEVVVHAEEGQASDALLAALKDDTTLQDDVGKLFERNSLRDRCTDVSGADYGDFRFHGARSYRQCSLTFV